MSSSRPTLWVALGAGGMALLIAGGQLLFRPFDSHETESAVHLRDGDRLAALDVVGLERLGVRTVALTSATTHHQLEGFARGVDAGPLAALVAEIETASATADASQAEAARLDALYRQDVSASRRAVELAQSQARADSARLRLAEQRIGLDYGQGLLSLGREGTQQLVNEIAWGKASLVRIDIHGGTLAPGTVVQIGEPDAALPVRVLGPAAMADPRMQSIGVLAVVKEPLAAMFQAGRIVTARSSTGPPLAATLIPREAVLRYQGRLWVFRREAGTFRRIPLEGPVPASEGWTVRTGLAPGDMIAISGATGLLAIDIGGDVSGTEDTD